MCLQEGGGWDFLSPTFFPLPFTLFSLTLGANHNIIHLFDGNIPSLELIFRLSLSQNGLFLGILSNIFSLTSTLFIFSPSETPQMQTPPALVTIKQGLLQ